MRRPALLLCLACACTFNVNGTPNTDLGPGESTTGEPDVSSEGSDGSTSTDPSADDSETTTPPDSSSGGPPADPAQLMFTPAELDFGNLAVDDDRTLTVDIKNIGGAPASFVTPVVIPGPFGLPGGYPGDGGTCGDTLDPGDSCTLEVRFNPNTLGPYTSALEVGFYDGVDLGQPAVATPVPLSGGAAGESDNLISNPSAEDGINGWTESLSNWDATTDDFVDGTAAFQSGNPIGGNTTLSQDISLSSWSDPLDVGGVHFQFSGSARVPDSVAGYAIELDFGISTQTPLQGNQTTWDAVDASGPVPIGADAVTVVLRCTVLGINECSALFDALSLNLVYPAP